MVFIIGYTVLTRDQSAVAMATKTDQLIANGDLYLFG